MIIGSKVKVKSAEVAAFVGQTGIIEGWAPNGGDTHIFKVRVGDTILPGWFGEDDLELLPRAYTTLIFDLDGTLTDSGEGIMRCAKYALSRFDIEVEDLQRLRPFVGPPLEDSFMELYGLSKKDAAKAVAYYRERYFSKGVYEQRLYPGMENLLKELRQDGYRLAIGTSKTMTQTNFVLDVLGISRYFDAVAARDENGRLHTKADVLNSLLGYMGVNSSKASCVMIGDRKYDIEGARLAGIDSIGILWGYGDRAELVSAGATHIATDIPSLLHFI